MSRGLKTGLLTLNKPHMTTNPFIFILLLLPWSAAGKQQASQPMVYDEKATEILQQASEVLAGYPELKVTFVYTMENPRFSEKESMDGTLYASGDKYHMKLGDNLFISDGEVAWTFLGEVNEVHISLVEHSQGSITPTSLLRDFQEDYRPRWISEEDHQGARMHVIDLFPEQPEAFYKYRTGICTRNFHLVYITAHDRQGGNYTYQITGMKPEPGIPTELFTFDPGLYPGIEVVDLR